MAEELYHSFRRRTAAVISRGGALPPVNKAATPRPHTLGGCVGVVLKALTTQSLGERRLYICRRAASQDLNQRRRLLRYASAQASANTHVSTPALRRIRLADPRTPTRLPSQRQYGEEYRLRRAGSRCPRRW